MIANKTWVWIGNSSGARQEGRNRLHHLNSKCIWTCTAVKRVDSREQTADEQSMQLATISSENSATGCVCFAFIRKASTTRYMACAIPLACCRPKFSPPYWRIRKAFRAGLRLNCARPETRPNRTFQSQLFSFMFSINIYLHFSPRSLFKILFLSF